MTRTLLRSCSRGGRTMVAGVSVALLIAVAGGAAAQSWSAPQRVVTQETTRHRELAVAVGPGGGVTLLGMRIHEGTPSIQAVRRARDGSWRSRRLSPIGSVASPQLAVDGNGIVTAVWTQGELYPRVTVRRRRSDGRWTRARAISSPASGAVAPRIAADADGNVVVVWWRIVRGHRTVEAAYKPVGRAWNKPVRLSQRGTDADHVNVTIDDDGHATAAWRAWRDGGDVLHAARRLRGGAWSAPVRVSGPSLSTDIVSLDADRRGTVTAVWSRKLRSGGFAVETATRPRVGSWTRPVRISPPEGLGGTPQVAVAPGGAAAAVWQQRVDGIVTVRAARRTAAGRWRTPRMLSEPGHHASYPQVVIDRRATITVVWQDSLDQRMVTVAASQVRGGAWTTTGDTLAVHGLASWSPVIGMDGRGRTTLAWAADRPTDSATWWYVATRR